MDSALITARVSAQTCTNKGFVKIAGIGLGIPCSIHLSYRGGATKSLILGDLSSERGRSEHAV